MIYGLRLNNQDKAPMKGAMGNNYMGFWVWVYILENRKKEKEGKKKWQIIVNWANGGLCTDCARRGLFAWNSVLESMVLELHQG